MRTSAGVLVLAVAIVNLACTGAALPTATASPAPSVPPTNTPTVSTTAVTTPAATPIPTATEAAPPTAEPTPSATATSTLGLPSHEPPPSFDLGGPFPNEAEQLLVSYVALHLQETCVRTDDIIYVREIDTITCGGDELPFDYSLIRTLEDLRAHYQQDISQSESPPQEDGTCSEGNYEASNEISGETVGRMNCRLHTSSTTGILYRVIEWTHEDLLVIGYISNRAELHSWEELINFWEDSAGPFAPD